MGKKISLVLIILLAVFIRFYQLADVPPSLNWDEISHGYNAYSLLVTGNDQWGASWPIFNFRAYGDYPMVLNLYLTMPFVAVFGLSELSVRLPSAILGSLTVLLVYLLALRFFKNQKLSLMAMLFAAIAPWMVLPSRAVFQSTIAQFFLMGGLCAFFYWLDSKKGKWLFISFISLALSQYGYHNTRIVVPLIFLSLIILYRRELISYFFKERLKLLFSLFIFIILTIAQLFNLFSGESRARGQWVFLIDQGAINTINTNRSTISNPLMGKIIYNKITYFVPRVIENYIDYFNPQKLFFTGGSNYQFSIPGWGVLYPIWLPFFYLGLISLILGIRKRNKIGIFCLIWYVVGLLPAVITKDGFQVIRSFSIMPLPILITILGIKMVSNYLNAHSKIINRILIFGLVIISLVTLIIYLDTLWGSYRKEYSWSWQYGYKQAVAYAKENYQKYDSIYVSKKYGEPHEYFLFWWPWSPKKYQQDPNLISNFHTNWYWVDGFDKFKFVNDWEIILKLNTENVKQNTLLITSPGNYPEGWKLIKTIYFLNNMPAFDLLENE
jgi:4-amino-4-deoxy-L-arabinose transferase-like glycosyltransferase